MPVPLSPRATITLSSSVRARMRRRPPGCIASSAFFRRLKKTCFTWLRSAMTDGSELSVSASTVMPRSAISFCWKASTLVSTSARSTSVRSGGCGRSALRKFVMMPSRRLTSSRQTWIDSASESVSLPALSLRSFRSISCRWMVSELRGLPSSCATPAARSRTDEVRSSWMRASVLSLSRVTSDRITAKRRLPPRPTWRNGTM